MNDIDQEYNKSLSYKVTTKLLAIFIIIIMASVFYIFLGQKSIIILIPVTIFFIMIIKKININTTETIYN